jgi:ferric-dicitrate binding protein FerR (iron transport regulator)
MDTESSSNDEVAIEALLRGASPRPAPPEDEVARVREAVRADWRKSATKHRRKVQLARLAVAASVVAAAFLALNVLQTGGVAPPTIAAIDRQIGLVRIVGEESDFIDGNELTQVTAGQVLRTGAEAGASLSWRTGGSLRIDADTRVEFVSGTEIRLHSGQIYYDSEPVLGARPAQRRAPLTIDTEFGTVTHVGTRYMTMVDRDGVTVSVRDGVVRTTSRSGVEADVGSREQLRLAPGGSTTRANVRPYGPRWEWIEQVSPAVSLDGRSVFEFLGWVSQETGLAVTFDSAVAEAYARRETLNGRLDATPRQALQIWMLATDLEWRIDNETGVIHVDSH